METSIITLFDSKLAERIMEYMRDNCHDPAGMVTTHNWYVRYEGALTSVCVNKPINPYVERLFSMAAEAYRRAVEDTLNGLLKEVSIKLPVKTTPCCVCCDNS